MLSLGSFGAVRFRLLPFYSEGCFFDGGLRLKTVGVGRGTRIWDSREFAWVQRPSRTLINTYVLRCGLQVALLWWELLSQLAGLTKGTEGHAQDFQIDHRDTLTLAF